MSIGSDNATIIGERAAKSEDTHTCGLPMVGGSMESILTTIYRPLTTRDNKGGTNSPLDIARRSGACVEIIGACPSLISPPRKAARSVYWVVRRMGRL